MKILKKDLKRGEIELLIESLDDLYALSTIIDAGDIVKGSTFRKIKIGGEEDRKRESSKIRVFLSVKAEKVEYEENILKVNGTILEGPDDITLNSYHTFNIEEGTKFYLIKKEWLDYELERLEEATSEDIKIMVCAFDRESAIFAKVTNNKIITIAKIKGDVERKYEGSNSKEDFFSTIAEHIKIYIEKHKLDFFIAACSSFWKQDLVKKIDPSLSKKIVYAKCSSVSEGGIDEALSSNETKNILHAKRITKESELIDDLLKEIAKEGLAEYGKKETENVASMGAVKKLMMTEDFIRHLKETGEFIVFSEILKLVENTKGKIHIISSDSDAGRKLQGLGGIAALLRFRP